MAALGELKAPLPVGLIPLRADEESDVEVEVEVEVETDVVEPAEVEPMPKPLVFWQHLGKYF